MEPNQENKRLVELERQIAEIKDQQGQMKTDDEIFIPEEERGTACMIHLAPISEENPSMGVVIHSKMSYDRFENNHSRQTIRVWVQNIETGEITTKDIDYTDHINTIEKVDAPKSRETTGLSKAALDKAKLAKNDLTHGIKEESVVTRNFRTGKKSTKVTKTPNYLNQFWEVEYNDKTYNIHFYSIN